MRISFANDYSEGCLPEILENLSKTNFEQISGYGLDSYSKSAISKIEELLGAEPDQVDIHFTVGGTQANLIVISHVLKPYSGVLSAPQGHIATHESAAIEATGHKVIMLDADPYSGKIDAQTLAAFLNEYWANPEPEHSPFPGMIYFSNATEYGTLYSAEEISAIRDVADKYDISIFMDGARLGTALTAEPGVLSFGQLLDLVDVFTIGGTKNGALSGEAIVFTNRKYNYGNRFRWTLKQRGGMLAKGRLLGIQFDTLFTDDLYFRAAKHANRMADLLRTGLKQRNVKFWTETKTNQLFILIAPEMKQMLLQDFIFLDWLIPTEQQLSELGLEKSDQEYHVIRLVTSWATQKEWIEQFLNRWDDFANL
ncbi:MAG: aminotransferase class I/II-fold pyridoxal phosphate-dependent enzyme [Clostridiaceae bacterium]|nr:aminotransferase class I/II-fold pyridoxal phosphate-dependent enzyme [Clostridiaceae bacterium]